MDLLQISQVYSNNINCAAHSNHGIKVLWLIENATIPHLYCPFLLHAYCGFSLLGAHTKYVHERGKSNSKACSIKDAYILSFTDDNGTRKAQELKS